MKTANTTQGENSGVGVRDVDYKGVFVAPSLQSCLLVPVLPHLCGTFCFKSGLDGGLAV